MLFKTAPLAAPRGMCKTADVALAVRRASGDSARSQPGVISGSRPLDELIVGPRAFAFLERGLPWQVSSPTKVL